MSGSQLSHESAATARLAGENLAPFVRELLDSNGDGTGTTNMNAGAGDIYYRKPDDNEIWVIHSMELIVIDNGDIPPDEFAAMGAVLPNGILARIGHSNADGTGDETLTDLLGGLVVTSNEELNHLGDIDFMIDEATESVIKCTVNFEKKFGFNLRLDTDDYIAIETQDDMSAVTSIYTFINGLRFKK